MATFKYVAKDMASKVQNGTMDADDRNELGRKLKDQGLYLVEYKDITKQAMNQYRLKYKELANYSREVGTMLSSGLSLIRTFSIMVRREDNKKIKKIGAPKTIDRIIDVFPPNKQDHIRTQLASVLQAVVTQQLLPLASGSGRTAALEVMVANDAIKNLIRENKAHQIDAMIQTGKNEGMISLNASLANLVRTGQVNQMIAEKYSLDVGELRQYL